MWVMSSRFTKASSLRAMASSRSGMALALNMMSGPRKPQTSASISSVSLEQSRPQPSSFRIRRMAGLGRAFTAKYSRKSAHQEKAWFSARARRRMPASS